jgi:hypothetical protein
MDIQWLRHWRREYYERYDRENYTTLVTKSILSREDVLKMLGWKSPRFGKKVKRKISSSKYLDKLNMLRINKIWKEDELDDFVRIFYPRYPKEAPIFGSFIKHVLKPDDFPIYDEYVHAAFHVLNGTSQRNCLMDCYPEYCDFFKKTKKKLKCSCKELDEALWAFGYDTAL